MNKSIILISFICITLLFASCSAQASNVDAAGTAKSAEATEQSAPAEPEKPTDSGLTLAGIKKAAEEAGYAVEAVEDFQMSKEPKPVDGFNVLYKDKNSESHIPILEFKNAEDALTYAEQVNEAGYNLCIVNGRHLTLTGAQYGVTVNDNEKNLLETLLKSKVMEYMEASSVPLEPAKDFAGAYLQIDAISKALDKLVNKSILLHDKAVPEDQRIGATLTVYSPLSSGDLAFTSNLCEDQAQLDAIVQVWEMFGCTDVKLRHDAAHDYVLTGKRAGLDTAFEIHCFFAPDTGSLRLTDIDGGEAFELYEFVPLGGDKYAFQTLYARAIVEYKDGEIISFIYSLNKTDKTLAYNFTSDSIYGKSGAVDEAWVSKAGEDSYERFISYDGAKLKIAADNFMGERLKAEIDAQ